MRVRVVIADDHDVVRQGLRMYLSLDPGIEIVGEAADGQEAVAQAHRLHPDVVLMDLLMPKTDGITATERIRTDLPDVEVLALTSVLEDGAVSAAVKAGAIGYLLKDTNAAQLCQALRDAAAGQVHLAPAAAARLLREVRAPTEPVALTGRELEVLKLVALGRANKEIARDLFVEEKTIKSHVSSILRKLGVRSRTQAALHAVRTGLVSMEQLGAQAW